jgi:lysine 2,3-aminomutase
LKKGIEIMEHLRGRLSGIAIPNFVVDAPNGGGKIELLPNYIVSMNDKETILRNFEGKLVSYPEPT